MENEGFFENEGWKMDRWKREWEIKDKFEKGNEGWRMKNEEEWRGIKNEGWRMKNEEWRMKNEEWRKKNEEWRMKNEEWRRM